MPENHRRDVREPTAVTRRANVAWASSLCRGKMLFLSTFLNVWT